MKRMRRQKCQEQTNRWLLLFFHFFLRILWRFIVSFV